MVGQIKIKKIVVVIFLTILIWVWADLAQDKRKVISRVPITLAQSTDRSVLVSFLEDENTFTDHIFVESIVLKGPASAIATVDRREKAGTLDLELKLVPKDEGITEVGQKNWPLLSFIRQSPTIRGLGLTVESCVPATVPVQVIALERKQVTLQCRDVEGGVITAAEIRPSSVEMFVPSDWEGEKLVATIPMSRTDLERAQKSEITKKAVIDIRGRKRDALEDIHVKIREEERLKPAIIEQPKFGILLNSTILNNYRVVIRDETVALRPIHIRATDEARRAYQNMRYHVVLVIDNTNRDLQGKTLEYRFPPEYVRKNEIVLHQSPQTVDFELIPLESPETTTTEPN